jgi:hypothetical protein
MLRRSSLKAAGTSIFEAVIHAHGAHPLRMKIGDLFIVCSESVSAFLCKQLPRAIAIPIPNGFGYHYYFGGRMRRP